MVVKVRNHIGKDKQQVGKVDLMSNFYLKDKLVFCLILTILRKYCTFNFFPF